MKNFINYVVSDFTNGDTFEWIRNHENVGQDCLVNGAPTLYFDSDTLEKMLNEAALGTREYLENLKSSNQYICSCGIHTNSFFIDYRNYRYSADREVSCACCFSLKDEYRNKLKNATRQGDIQQIKDILFR